LGFGHDRLLDVGYGSGVFFPELARHAHALAGVDVHDKTAEVERILERHGIVADLRTAPAEALPFPDESFDAAVVVSAFEFVDDVELATAELRRVLVPGGRAVVVTPGHAKVFDVGLRLLTGERAEDTFRGRRKLVIPALRRHLRVERVRRMPNVPGLWLHAVVTATRAA
jgi:SAM-dependent methyltransferase